MKTFYAVTDGDYSDYHIIAITDNKERAENIKKLYGNNEEHGICRREGIPVVCLF